MHPANNLDLSAAPPTDLPELLALPQRQKVVLVMDLVESVRLMAANELAVVDHWRGFVRHATKVVLPKYEGRMVKSLGDGIMVEFESPRNATNAAVQLHRYFDTANAALPASQQLFLRAGLNTAQVYIDDIDIYGSGVNLAARVASLAGPGEIMLTTEVRDGLTDGLDAKVEDMGECYLKHVAKPVRAFRVGEAGQKPLLTPQRDNSTQLQPTIAVVPFESHNLTSENLALGHLIADGVIAQISRTKGLNIISGLSSATFANRVAPLADIRMHLGADFVVTGSYTQIGSRLLISTSLCVARTEVVVWADRFQGDLADLLQANSSLCAHIANAVHIEVIQSSAESALTRPMPTLASQTLMLGAVNLMHRSAPGDFQSSRRALDVLIERHPRAAACRAWLAKWCVLRATRGLTDDDQRKNAIEALDQTHRALEQEPANSTALAMQGFVRLHLQKDFERSNDSLNTATLVNPNDALAWLFKSVLASFEGDAKNAVFASERALILSPLDPLRYYFESLAASSCLAAEDWQGAQALCLSSLKRNRMHAHTYRALITAYWYDDQPTLARQAAQALLRVAPSTTMARFLKNSASADLDFGKRMATALRGAGIADQ